ncbi:MAG: AbrB/MazE/SpoVT family DNA-binding domain-containing protein [Trueperaceae bacterium]|nr:AbrB/MazE/SpoVT family DNA-binding domain-containing protein [Trueperaceae bacterium]MDZ7705532.1 AbrB/MazE/SpoVT family DNA-binding domain-containing protein [Trueperaceae bacterium]
MDVVKLGKKGQVSIPKKIIDELGIESESLLIVETTEDGALILRPAGVYPIEIYSDERLAEFAAADEMSPEMARRVEEKLNRNA